MVMIGFLSGVFWEVWEILKEASVFLIFGFLLAGALAVFVPQGLLTRLVGTGRVKSVFWASVLGAPLPLCSCGVLPTALGLRKQGATPGATVAFLVATPETGADSISLTYALTDPVMTVFRPIAGVATALAAGLATNFFDVPRGRHAQAPAMPPGVVRYPDASQGAHREVGDDGHGHAHAPDPWARADDREHARTTAFDAARRVVRYAFVELLDDISYWLVLGIVLSAVATVALPPELFEGIWGGGIASMVLMLILGVPLYTCASSSTPMAAALALKGLSPGAALVFLLAGPATNLGGLVVLLKVLGRRAVAVYLTAVVAATLAAGLVLNTVYRAWGLDPRATFGTAPEFVPNPVKIAGAVALIALLVVSMRRTRVPDEWIWLRDKTVGRTGYFLKPRSLKATGLAAGVVLWLGSGLFTVGPGEIGMRLRFGAIVASDLAPGLHFRWPWPFEADRIVGVDQARRVEFGIPPTQSREATTRAQLRGRLPFGSNPAPVATQGIWFQKETSTEDSFLLTGDSNLIDLRSAAQYRVKAPLAYAYNLAEPEALVRSTIMAALRGVVATHAIDAVYTTARGEIERETRQAAQTMLDRYQAGIEILSVRLLYDHPPAEVHDAFRDVASAQEDKLRTINLANVFAVEKINQAKGEAAAMTEGALAFKEQRIIGAQAGADAFALRLGAYRRSPELTKFRLQLETLEEVLPGIRKFVRPGAGEVKDFDMWLLQPFGTSQSR
jgi:HflK protein